MKRIIASAGLVALGAASLHAAYAPGMSSMERAKPWSLSLALRGFYDDNYTTSPSSVAQESFGVEVSPAFSLNLPLDRTFISLGYVYSMKWYEAREDDSIDQSHRINLKVDHTFSERFRMEVSDSFVISDEPQVLATDGLTPVPIRTVGSNTRNLARVEFDAQITQSLDLAVSYSNTLWDYEEDGFASYSALLDRMEHLPGFELRYRLQPQTVGLLGFQYGQIGYTSSDLIALGVNADYRDNKSYTIFTGAEHNFTSQWNGNLRVGAMGMDYTNAGDSQWSPWVQLSTSYTYNPGSYAQFGFRYTHNPTDVGTYVPGGSITLDQETAAAYLQLNHKISGNLTANAITQLQYSTFNGGTVDGEVDLLFLAGVNLNYRYSEHMSAELGYNFDRLDSDLVNRSYSRNQVYFGIRASF